MNIIGICILSLLLGVVFFAPKRWALLGIMAGVLYLTLGQMIDVFGLHVYPIRLLTLAGFMRVLISREFSFLLLNRMDKILLLVYGYRTFVFLLNSNGSSIAAVGLMVDVTLAYFAFRGLIQTFDDMIWFLRTFVILLAPYVVMLVFEMWTWQNPFGIIGGITDLVLRNGRPRCIGSFGHASILGTFGASFLPLYIGLAINRDNRMRAIVGIGLCLGIVLLTNSGGPLGCSALGIIGWLLWFARAKMFVVRRIIFAALFLAGLVMKAPIWYLPGKLSSLTGGDGWHRSYLMEVAFKDIDHWWLAGMSILETKAWFPYLVVTGGADITNYYLDFGIAAGLMAMGLFIWLLIRAFSRLGEALLEVRFSRLTLGDAEHILWALGVVLTVHVFNWFALIYFDQYYVVFFMQFAAISTLSDVSIKHMKEFSKHIAPVMIAKNRNLSRYRETKKYTS